MIQQKSHQKNVPLTHNRLFSSVPKRLIPAILFFVFTFNFHFTSQACSPLVVPTLLGQTVTPTALLLDWQSTNQWTGGCTYSVQVELICLGQSFTGNGPFFYSPLLTKTTTPQSYPQQTVSLSALCPGSVYQFRAREEEAGGFVQSGWTSTYTFTTPGTFVPPTLNVSSSNNIICPPQTITAQLNAGLINACGGPYTYSWSPATGLNSYTIASPVATVTAPITYSVVVTGGPLGCWIASGSVNITALSTAPTSGTASATPSVICTGLTTMLVLTGYVGNIQWQSSPSSTGPWSDIPGAVTNSYVTSPLTANTCFQALVSSCTSTVPSGAFCVTVDQNPVFVPAVMQISCTNSVATANMGNPGTSGNPTSYTWSPAPISSQGSTATYTTPGNVNVTATFSDGCSAGASMTIKPPPPPVTFSITNVTGSASITCTYPTVDLSTASSYTYGAVDYFWSSSSFTANTQSFTVTNPATYTCLVTDPITNCAASHTIHIYQNTTAPTANVSPVNQNINCGAGVTAQTCTGTATSPTTNVTQMWYAPGSPNPVTSQGVTSLFAPTIVGTNGTNTLVVKDDINGCTVTKYVTVTSSFAYPSFTLNSSQNYSVGCTTTSLTNVVVSNAQSNSPIPGASISYTLLPPGYSGGSGYQTSTSNIFTITTPGNYTVIVKDNSNFCESHLPVSIVQNTFAPDISANATTFTLSCAVPSLELSGYSANSLQGPVTYNWFYQNGGNPGNVIAQSLPVNINAAVPTNSIINTYSLQIKEINNACISNTVITMYQNTRPPKASIGVTLPYLTCSTNSISLTNNSSTGILPNTFFISQPVVGLLWEGPTPQLPDSFSSSYYAYTAGIYTLTAEDINNGCTSQTTTTITDQRIYPVIVTSTQVALDCNAATGGGVKLAATVQSLTPAQVTAQWAVPLPTPNVFGAGTLTLTTDGVGEYQLVVTTNSNQCTRSVLVDVVAGMLTADFAPDKQTGFAPLTVNFVNNSTSSSQTSGTSSITSVWSFGNGTTKTTTTNLSTSAVYSAPGSYTVTMFTSKGSCRDTLSKVIVVDIPSQLIVPNIFTPNGDNNNDLFFVQAANLTQITAEIFDRWGNKIYDITSSTGNIAWDGKNQSGHEAPAGTYFYTIKATGKDGQNYDTKGTVSLYR